MQTLPLRGGRLESLDLAPFLVPVGLLQESLHRLGPWVDAVFLAHALAPFCEVLEDGAFAGEVKPFLRLLVLHHFGDLQHEGPAAAHGLREALLQQLFPPLQRLLFKDGLSLFLISTVEACEAANCKIRALALQMGYTILALPRKTQ